MSISEARKVADTYFWNRLRSGSVVAALIFGCLELTIRHFHLHLGVRVMITHMIVVAGIDFLVGCGSKVLLQLAGASAIVYLTVSLCIWNNAPLILSCGGAAVWLLTIVSMIRDSHRSELHHDDAADPSFTSWGWIIALNLVLARTILLTPHEFSPLFTKLLASETGIFAFTAGWACSRVWHKYLLLCPTYGGLARYLNKKLAGGNPLSSIMSGPEFLRLFRCPLHQYRLSDYSTALQFAGRSADVKCRCQITYSLIFTSGEEAIKGPLPSQYFDVSLADTIKHLISELAGNGYRFSLRAGNELFACRCFPLKRGQQRSMWLVVEIWLDYCRPSIALADPSDSQSSAAPVELQTA